MLLMIYEQAGPWVYAIFGGQAAPIVSYRLVQETVGGVVGVMVQAGYEHESLVGLLVMMCVGVVDVA